LAKNDILLNIGFKINKANIDTKALTESITKALKNVSIDKISIDKKVLNDVFKGFTPKIDKLTISRTALKKAFADAQQGAGGGFTINRINLAKRSLSTIKSDVIKALKETEYSVKVNKVSITQKAISSAFENATVKFTKAQITKSAINEAIKDFPVRIQKAEFSGAAISGLESQLKKILKKFSIGGKNTFKVGGGGGGRGRGRGGSGRGGGGGGGTPNTPPPTVRTPGSALVRGRELAIEKAYQAVVEEVANSTLPRAVKAQIRYNRAINQGGISLKELGARVSTITQRFSEYAIAIRVVGNLQRALGAAIKGTLDFDEAIQDLSKVEGAAKDIGKAFGALSTTAIATGKSIEEVSTAINEFVRQGKSLTEAATFAETALKLSNISNLNAADSARLATAAQQVFGVSSENLAQKLGTIAVFADQSATSVTEIGTAFLRSASSAEAAEVEFEQFIGILAATLEQTRLGAAQVGTAFKTLFARTQKFRPEITELANSFAAAQGNQDLLIKSSDNVLAIFTKLAKIFPLLNAGQKNQIANQVAGVRQANVFIGALQNLDKAQLLYNQSVDGATALNEKNQKQLETLTVRATNLTTAFKSLAASIAGVSTGQQGGAAGFAGSFLDTFTQTLSAIGSLTTSLDEFEAAGVNVGSAFKSAILGVIVSIVKTISGPLLTGVKDFFGISSASAKNLSQALVNAEKQYASTGKIAFESAKQTALAYEQAVLALNNAQKQLKAQIQAQTNSNKLTNEKLKALKAQERAARRLVQELARVARSQNIELRNVQEILKATKERVKEESKLGKFFSSKAGGAVAFAGADALAQIFSSTAEGLRTYAEDIRESGRSLAGVTAEQRARQKELLANIAEGLSSFAREGVLLGALFGKLGLAISAVTASVTLAVKTISNAAKQAAEDVTSLFVQTALAKVLPDLVKGIREAGSVKKELQSLALSGLELQKSEQVRINIVNELNKVSNDYLTNLKQQSLELSGLSTEAANFIATIGSIENDISGIKIRRPILDEQNRPTGSTENIVIRTADVGSKGLIKEFIEASRNGLEVTVQSADLEALAAQIDETQTNLASLQGRTESAAKPLEDLRRRLELFRSAAETGTKVKFGLLGKDTILDQDPIRVAIDDLQELQRRIDLVNEARERGVSEDDPNFPRFTEGVDALDEINKTFEKLGGADFWTRTLAITEGDSLKALDLLITQLNQDISLLDTSAEQNQLVTQIEALQKTLTEEQQKQGAIIQNTAKAYQSIQDRINRIRELSDLAAQSQEKFTEEASEQLKIDAQKAKSEKDRERVANRIAKINSLGLSLTEKEYFFGGILADTKQRLLDIDQKSIQNKRLEQQEALKQIEQLREAARLAKEFGNEQEQRSAKSELDAAETRAKQIAETLADQEIFLRQLAEQQDRQREINSLIEDSDILTKTILVSNEKYLKSRQKEIAINNEILKSASEINRFQQTLNAIDSSSLPLSAQILKLSDKRANAIDRILSLEKEQIKAAELRKILDSDNVKDLRERLKLAQSQGKVEDVKRIKEEISDVESTAERDAGRIASQEILNKRIELEAEQRQKVLSVLDQVGIKYEEFIYSQEQSIKNSLEQISLERKLLSEKSKQKTSETGISAITNSGLPLFQELNVFAEEYDTLIKQILDSEFKISKEKNLREALNSKEIKSLEEALEVAKSQKQVSLEQVQTIEDQLASAYEIAELNASRLAVGQTLLKQSELEAEKVQRIAKELATISILYKQIAFNQQESLRITKEKLALDAEILKTTGLADRFESRLAQVKRAGLSDSQIQANFAELIAKDTQEIINLNEKINAAKFKQRNLDTENIRNLRAKVALQEKEFSAGNATRKELEDSKKLLENAEKNAVINAKIEAATIRQNQELSAQIDYQNKITELSEGAVTALDILTIKQAESLSNKIKEISFQKELLDQNSKLSDSQKEISDIESSGLPLYKQIEAFGVKRQEIQKRILEQEQEINQANIARNLLESDGIKDLRDRYNSLLVMEGVTEQQVNQAAEALAKAEQQAKQDASRIAIAERMLKEAKLESEQREKINQALNTAYILSETIAFQQEESLNNKLEQLKVEREINKLSARRQQIEDSISVITQSGLPLSKQRESFLGAMNRETKKLLDAEYEINRVKYENENLNTKELQDLRDRVKLAKQAFSKGEISEQDFQSVQKELKDREKTAIIDAKILADRERINSQVERELNTQNEINKLLKNVESIKDVAIVKQKEFLNNAREEIEVNKKIASLNKIIEEAESRGSDPKRYNLETSRGVLSYIRDQKDTLKQVISAEYEINKIKRERELLNSEEINNLKEAANLARVEGRKEDEVEAIAALEQAESSARKTAEELARLDTDFAKILEDSLAKVAKNLFERVQGLVKQANDRVEESERRRVDASNALIEANSKVLEEERNLASARANLESANSSLVSALREAADAQARYRIDVRNAQRSALEATGVQFSLANSFSFASQSIDQVTNKLFGTIASEQLLAQIRSQAASELLQKVTQLASTISGFAVNFFTSSDQQRQELQRAQTVAQQVASGEISVSAVPEELRSAVAQFTDIIPGLKERIESFGAGGLGLSNQLEQLRQVSVQLAKDSVSRDQLKTSQDALAAARSQVDKAEQGVQVARDQLIVANIQKQIALNNLSQAISAKNIAVNDSKTLSFYTDRALDKLKGIDEGTRNTMLTLESVGRDIVSAIRSISFISSQNIPNAAGGTLTNSEITGLIGAARREKRLMPAGSRLMLANTSETVLTRRQAKTFGFRPRTVSNAANGNGDVGSLTSLVGTLVSEIRALRSDISTGGVQQVNLNVDTQRNINVKGIEGLSQRLERELSGKFATGGELEAIGGLISDIIIKMNENGLMDGLGR